MKSQSVYTPVVLREAIVHSDPTYDVVDASLFNLVISETTLHRGKHTTGHAHKETDEVYVFTQGRGSAELDFKRITVVQHSIVVIPAGAFHRIWNRGNEDLVFISVFAKYGDRR